MDKIDLINEVAKYTHTKIEAAKAVNIVFETIKRTLQEGNKVTIPGFGTFSIGKMTAKTAITRTGNPIRFAAKNIPKFTAGRDFRDTVK
ncbi:MAG: HU family DNA-binding protein [Syntrophaceae bacterium]